MAVVKLFCWNILKSFKTRFKRIAWPMIIPWYKMNKKVGERPAIYFSNTVEKIPSS
jgi:hypothetical protein